jgi:uncharacterized protein YjbI with pentapeptide repeats
MTADFLSWFGPMTARLSVRRWILPGMAIFKDQDLTDAKFRECNLTRARLIGPVSGAAAAPSNNDAFQHSSGSSVTSTFRANLEAP